MYKQANMVSVLACHLCALSIYGCASIESIELHSGDYINYFVDRERSRVATRVDAELSIKADGSYRYDYHGDRHTGQLPQKLAEETMACLNDAGVFDLPIVGGGMFNGPPIPSVRGQIMGRQFSFATRHGAEIPQSVHACMLPALQYIDNDNW